MIFDRKEKILLLFFITFPLLCSCFMNGDSGMNEKKKADTRMEQIIAAIKDKDRTGLKALFSKQAINEANDFDSCIDYLFNFLQDDVKSWERYKWSSDVSLEYGKKSKMLRSWYTVITEKNKYSFFIIDFTEETINPDNFGLYTLRVIKTEDEEIEFTYWQDMQIAGIYRP